MRITTGVARTETTKPTESFSTPSALTETVTDAHWSDVVFLLQSNDQDTSNSFSDTGGSATTHIVSQTNGAIHSTDFAKFGTSSIKIDKNSSQVITVPPSDELSMGTGDFTIEWWQYMDSDAIRQWVFSLGDWGGSGMGIGFNDEWSNSINAGFWLFHSGAWANSYHLGGGVDQWKDAWHHFAVVRSNDILKVYIDGVSRGSTSNGGDGGAGLDVSSWDHSSGTNGLRVGHSITHSSYYWSGYLEDFRITKGVARYTEDFPNSLPVTTFGQTYDIGDSVVVTSASTADTMLGNVSLLLTGEESTADSSMTLSQGSTATERIGNA